MHCHVVLRRSARVEVHPIRMQDRTVTLPDEGEGSDRRTRLNVKISLVADVVVRTVVIDVWLDHLARRVVLGDGAAAATVAPDLATGRSLIADHGAAEGGEPIAFILQLVLRAGGTDDEVKVMGGRIARMAFRPEKSPSRNTSGLKDNPLVLSIFHPPGGSTMPDSTAMWKMA